MVDDCPLHCWQMGHSITTWTEFWHFLDSPPSLRGQSLYPERGQKQSFFDPLPPLILASYASVPFSIFAKSWGAINLVTKLKFHKCKNFTAVIVVCTQGCLLSCVFLTVCQESWSKNRFRVFFTYLIKGLDNKRLPGNIIRRPSQALS